MDTVGIKFIRGCSSGDRGGGNNGSKYGDITGHLHGHRYGGNGATVPVPLLKGGISDTGGLPRGPSGGIIHLAGGGSNPLVGVGIPRHCPGGDVVEGGDGHSQLQPHQIHHLARRHTSFTAGLQHWDRLPQGKTAPSVNGHEGKGHERDISGPAPGLWSLGQEHMTGYLVGVLSDVVVLRHTVS